MFKESCKMITNVSWSLSPFPKKYDLQSATASSPKTALHIFDAL